MLCLNRFFANCHQNVRFASDSRNPDAVCMSRSSAEGQNLVMPSSMDVSLTMRKTFLKMCACRGSAYRRRCGPWNAEGDTEGFLEVCRTSQANLYMTGIQGS